MPHFKYFSWAIPEHAQKTLLIAVAVYWNLPRQCLCPDSPKRKAHVSHRVTISIELSGSAAPGLLLMRSVRRPESRFTARASVSRGTPFWSDICLTSKMCFRPYCQISNSTQTPCRRWKMTSRRQLRAEHRADEVHSHITERAGRSREGRLPAWLLGPAEGPCFRNSSLIQKPLKQELALCSDKKYLPCFWVWGNRKWRGHWQPSRPSLRSEGCRPFFPFPVSECARVQRKGGPFATSSVILLP